MRTIVAAFGIATMIASLPSSATLAQGAGAGPVGTQCKADVASFCKTNGDLMPRRRSWLQDRGCVVTDDLGSA